MGLWKTSFFEVQKTHDFFNFESVFKRNPGILVFNGGGFFSVQFVEFFARQDAGFCFEQWDNEDCTSFSLEKKTPKMKSQEKKNKFLTVVLVAHLEPNTFAWKTFASLFGKPGFPHLEVDPCTWKVLDEIHPLRLKQWSLRKEMKIQQIVDTSWLSGTMILTLLFCAIFSKIVDWMGFIGPQTLKDAICVFDAWTKSGFEFSDVCREVSVENTFDPSHAPFLHNGISKYSPDKAGDDASKTVWWGENRDIAWHLLANQLMVQKSGVHQLRLVVYPTFDRVSLIHPRWLFLGFLPQYDWTNTPPKKNQHLPVLEEAKSMQHVQTMMPKSGV